MHLRFLYMEKYQHLLTSSQRIASPKVLGVLGLFELLEPRELFLSILSYSKGYLGNSGF